MGLTVRNIFQDLERIQARMIVLDEHDIKAGWDRCTGPFDAGIASVMSIDS